MSYLRSPSSRYVLYIGFFQIVTSASIQSRYSNLFKPVTYVLSCVNRFDNGKGILRFPKGQG